VAHPWSLESRSSKDHPKCNWYIWKDAREDGGYPNNWLSSFGGSAWRWDEKIQQYYHHAFAKAQPDLSWRNLEVQRAMFEMTRFWLDRGVDGFRVDVMWHLIKDEQLRDNPPNPAYQAHMSTFHQLLPLYSTDQPEVHDIVRQMREVLDTYEDRMMIGETYLPIHKPVTYYGIDLKGAHLPFNFQLISFRGIRSGSLPLSWSMKPLCRANIEGDFVPVYADHQLISCLRQAAGSPRFLIVLNLSHRPCYFRTSTEALKGVVEICTAPELEGRTVSGTIPVEGNEGVIVRLRSPTGRQLPEKIFKLAKGKMYLGKTNFDRPDRISGRVLTRFLRCSDFLSHM
jgi:hypothetical protein